MTTRTTSMTYAVDDSLLFIFTPIYALSLQPELLKHFSCMRGLHKCSLPFAKYGTSI